MPSSFVRGGRYNAICMTPFMMGGSVLQLVILGFVFSSQCSTYRRYSPGYIRCPRPTDRSISLYRFGGFSLLPEHCGPSPHSTTVNINPGNPSSRLHVPHPPLLTVHFTTRPPLEQRPKYFPSSRPPSSHISSLHKCILILLNTVQKTLYAA